MKLRVRKYSRGVQGHGPPNKMISRSIVVCFGDSFSHFFVSIHVANIRSDTTNTQTNGLTDLFIFVVFISLILL